MADRRGRARVEANGDLLRRVRVAEQELADHRRELAIQFKRMAQLQAHLDETVAQFDEIRTAWVRIKSKVSRG